MNFQHTIWTRNAMMQLLCAHTSICARSVGKIACRKSSCARCACVALCKGRRRGCVWAITVCVRIDSLVFGGWGEAWNCWVHHIVLGAHCCACVCCRWSRLSSTRPPVAQRQGTSLWMSQRWMLQAASAIWCTGLSAAMMTQSMQLPTLPKRLDEPFVPQDL